MFLLTRIWLDFCLRVFKTRSVKQQVVSDDSIKFLFKLFLTTFFNDFSDYEKIEHFLLPHNWKLLCNLKNHKHKKQ